MSPTQSRRPRAERRDQIARTALEIIGTRGVTTLTMATLAEAIGVTSGALFRHFSTREEILDEAVRLALARVEETFPDLALPPLGRLRQLALARVHLLTTEPGVAWLLRSQQAHLALPPDAVKRLRGLAAKSRSYIRSALAEAVAAGEVRADIPVDVLLLVFTATVHALIGDPDRRAPGPGGKQPTPAIEGLLAMLAPATAPTPGSES